MLQILNIFCIYCTLSLVASFEMYSDKSWTYQLLSIESKTSDPALIDIDIQVERISRNEFAMSGTWKQNYEITIDTLIEFRAFHSATGTSEYYELPYSVKKQPYFQYLNTFYKEMIMESLGKCSNFPQFTDDFEPPWEQKTYEMKQCKISNEKLPQHLQEGFYKVLLEVTGEGPEWSIEGLVKIETNY